MLMGHQLLVSGSLDGAILGRVYLSVLAQDHRRLIVIYLMDIVLLLLDKLFEVLLANLILIVAFNAIIITNGLGVMLPPRAHLTDLSSSTPT